MKHLSNHDEIKREIFLVKQEVKSIGAGVGFTYFLFFCLFFWVGIRTSPTPTVITIDSPLIPVITTKVKPWGRGIDSTFTYKLY